MAGRLETAPKSRFAGGMHNLLGLSRCQHADMCHKAAGKAILVLPTPSYTERCSPSAVQELEGPSMRWCFHNHRETGSPLTGATTTREHTALQPPEVLPEDNG